MPADARRTMILDAALPLILEHGEKVTTSEIAVAAEIAEGTIFRVFANKDELIHAVVDRTLDPAPTEAAIAAVDTSVGLERSVVEVVKLLQKRFSEVWQLMSSVGPRFHAHSGPFDSPALANLFKHFSSELDAKPVEAAQLLRGVTISLSHNMFTPVAAPPERVAQRFLHGVSLRPSGALSGKNKPC